MEDSGFLIIPILLLGYKVFEGIKNNMVAMDLLKRLSKGAHISTTSSLHALEEMAKAHNQDLYGFLKSQLPEAQQAGMSLREFLRLEFDLAI